VFAKSNGPQATSRVGPAGADGNRRLFSYPGMASHFDTIGGASLVLGGFMYVLVLHRLGAASCVHSHPERLGRGLVIAGTWHTTTSCPWMKMLAPCCPATMPSLALAP